MRLTRHAERITLLNMVLDLSIVLLSWMTCYLLRFESGLFDSPLGAETFWHFMRPSLPLVFCYFVTFVALGTYQKRMQPLRSWQEYTLCAKAHGFAFAFFITVNYFLFDHRYSRISAGLFFVVTPVLLAFGRSFGRKISRWLLKRQPTKNHEIAVLIGDGPQAKKVVELIESRRDWNLHLRHVLHPNETAILKQKLSSEKIDTVFIASFNETAHEMQQIFEALSTTTADLYVLPYVGENHFLTPQVYQIQGIPLVALNLSHLDATGKLLKRLFDIVFSSCFLVVFSPVFFVCALLVKVTSPGPIFYKQERMGLDGKSFYCIKFRGMVCDAEVRSGGPVWAQKNDNRLTPIGKWLRKTSLDEIPQFFNVLCGDMSVVGPRPERPVFVEEFRNQIPGYMLRHKVKAGITGWAQINGWRGNTSLEKRIECDLWYIQNWSLWLDFKICLLTPLKGFVHPHAY